MRVQSEHAARLDDRRSIVALNAAGQGHARPTQGTHAWFVTKWGFSAAPEAPTVQCCLLKQLKVKPLNLKPQRASTRDEKQRFTALCMLSGRMRPASVTPS